MLSKDVFKCEMDLNNAIPDAALFFKLNISTKGDPLHIYMNSLATLNQTLLDIHSSIEIGNVLKLKFDIKNLLTALIEHVDHCEECLALYDKSYGDAFVKRMKHTYRNKLGAIVNTIKHDGDVIKIFKKDNLLGFCVYETGENLYIKINKNVHELYNNMYCGLSIPRLMLYSLVAIYFTSTMMCNILKYKCKDQQLLPNPLQSSLKQLIAFKLTDIFVNESIYPCPSIQLKDNRLSLELAEIKTLNLKRKLNIVSNGDLVIYTSLLKDRIYGLPWEDQTIDNRITAKKDHFN